MILSNPTFTQQEESFQKSQEKVYSVSKNLSKTNNLQT